MHLKILLLTWEYPPLLIGGLGRHVFELCQHLLSSQKSSCDPHLLCPKSPESTANSAGEDCFLDIVIVTRQEHSPAAALAETEFMVENETACGSIRVIRTSMDPIDLTFSEDLVAWVFALGFALLRAYDAHLEHWKPDIIHAHDWLVAQPAISLAERYNVPLVSTLHATEVGRHTGWIASETSKHIHSLEYWLAHNSDVVISCSDFMRTEIISAYHVDAKKITTIPNGIDSAFWCSNVPDRGKLSSYPVLLFFGRLEYEKGIHILIRALPQVLRVFPNAILKIVGDGTQKTWLQEIVRENQLENQVIFHGSLAAQDLRQVIDSSDIAIFPSIYEPFGLVALEAAAREIPIIASARTGLAEFLISAVQPHILPGTCTESDNDSVHRKEFEDPRVNITQSRDHSENFLAKSVSEHYNMQDLLNCCLIQPGDSSDAARTIIAALENYPCALDLAQQYHQRVGHSDFQWSNIAVKTQALYLSLVGSGHHRQVFSTPKFPKNIIIHRP